MALARLVVDNVPSIQVDWSLYGPKLAQVALTVGADDVDGVSPEDDMTRGPPARAARGDPPEHPRGRPGAGRAERPLRSRGWMTAPSSDGRRSASAPSGTSTRVRSSTASIDRRASTCATTCRRSARGCCTRATIDVGLIPSIEYLRGDAYRIVPDLAIASRGPVASVALYTTRPMRDVRSIAMDTSSRTSVALVRVLVRAAVQDPAGHRVARSGPGRDARRARRGARHRRQRAALAISSEAASPAAADREDRSRRRRGRR